VQHYDSLPNISFDPNLAHLVCRKGFLSYLTPGAVLQKLMFLMDLNPELHGEEYSHVVVRMKNFLGVDKLAEMLMFNILWL
jgi:hypothetical protein